MRRSVHVEKLRPFKSLLHIFMKKTFKTYIIFNRNDASKIMNVSNANAVFLHLDELISIAQISRRQMNLFLFRHPEIKTLGKGKKKLVEVSILPHLLEAVIKKQKTCRQEE